MARGHSKSEPQTPGRGAGIASEAGGCSGTLVNHLIFGRPVPYVYIKTFLISNENSRPLVCSCTEIPPITKTITEPRAIFVALYVQFIFLLP